MCERTNDLDDPRDLGVDGPLLADVDPEGQPSLPEQPRVADAIAIGPAFEPVRRFRRQRAAPACRPRMPLRGGACTTPRYRIAGR